jgi:hypothetical protein
MKKFVIALIAVLISNVGTSQTEKTEQNEANCEDASKKYGLLLSKYSIEQNQAIHQILELWEESCGETEPIQRVKILLDISNNSFIDSAYSDYFGARIFDFFDRVDAAYKDDFQEKYNNNKEYFNYVPLRSAFDDWTWNVAKNLKEKQKRGTSAYLMTVLFSEDIKTFDDELKTDTYKNNYIKTTLDEVVYNSTNDPVNLVLNAGVWMPIGDLRWKFSLSPMIGIGANISISKKYSIEFGAQFTFWTNNKELIVNIEDSVQSIDSKYGGTYGIWVHRKLSFENDNFIDLTSGIAYTSIGTGIEKENSDDEDGTSYYHIGTIELSLGFDVRKKVNFKKNDIGLSFAYHFRPYNIDKRLETGLGNHSYSLCLFYWF